MTGNKRGRATVVANVRVRKAGRLSLAFAMKRVDGDWKLAAPLPSVGGG